MSQPCPDCGSHDTLAFVDEIGQQVCSNCGAVSQELQFYQPSNRYEVACALGGPAADRVASSSLFDGIGISAPPYWTRTLEDSRRRNEFIRKPEVDARIQGTLATLGYPGLFAQVDFLFQRARQKSWEGSSKQDSVSRAEFNSGFESIDGAASPSLASGSSSVLPSSFAVRRVRWGNDSLLLATACCYAVLRREGVRIDLQTVSDAAHLPYPNVRRAFKLLRLLVKDAVRNVQLSNPDSYVAQVIAFFRFQLAVLRTGTTAGALSANVVKFLKALQMVLASTSKSSSRDRGPSLPNTSLEVIEATAFDICAFWWPRRERYDTNPRLAAFAAVVLAIEVRTKTLAPLLEIFRLTYQALSFNPLNPSSAVPSSSQPDSDDPTSKRAVALYGQTCSSLRAQAATIPWLGNLQPISRKSRARASAQGGITDLVRRDLIVHALEILHVWRAVSLKRSENGNASNAAAPGTATVPEPASAPDPQSHARTSMQEIDPSDDDADIEVGSDELDCFVSSSSAKDEVPSQADPEAADGASDLDDGTDDEVWPRIEDRIRAATRDEGPAAQHPIDQLSGQQVDELLFSPDELGAMFRTDPAELAAFERAKIATGDWPATQQDEARPTHTPAVRRPEDGRAQGGAKRSKGQSAADPVSKRKRRKQALSPVSLREQQDESDWSE